MAKIWCSSTEARFHEVGPNMFVISFATRGDKKRVKNCRPWLFDHNFFAIESFDGFTQPQHMKLRVCIIYREENVGRNFIIYRLM